MPSSRSSSDAGSRDRAAAEAAAAAAAATAEQRRRHITSARNALNRQRGHLRGAIEAAQSLIDSVGTGGGVTALAEAKRIIAKLNDQAEKVAAKVEYFLSLGAGDEADNQVEANQADIHRAYLEVHAALVAMCDRLEPAAPAPAPRNPNSKLNTSMKPAKDLHADWSVQDYNAWKVKLETYFESRTLAGACSAPP